MQNWQITSEVPIPIEEMEVIGYHPDWIDPDFNPKGTRVGFMRDDGVFISAKWWDYQDAYVNCENLVPIKWHKIAL